MKITFDANSAPIAGEVWVRFFTKEERAAIPITLSEAEWSAAPNALLHLHRENLLCVGLGEAAKLNAKTLRSAAGAAIMSLKKAGRTQVALDLRSRPQFSQAAVEGAVLAEYRYEKFKEKKTAALRSLRGVADQGELAAVKAAGRRGEAIAHATNFARSIGNEPGNVIVPKTLADEARKLAARSKLTVKILDEPALRRGKFGGILAVGQGSANSPRLIVIEHRGGPASQAPIALVGKAITFDTGGISIKPAGSMEEMIFDKSGGMAVLGAMSGIAALKLKRNVIGIIAAAENMPGPAAYRPGDIVTTFDGQHIEIVNTDAEGRVVLADAIAYARREARAAAIIDLATLTGACGVALGEYAAGLWSTSEELKTALLAAGEKAGERMWPMPLYDEYSEQIRSDVAALKNSGGSAAPARRPHF